MNKNHTVITTQLSAWWHTYRQLERVTGSQSRLFRRCCLSLLAAAVAQGLALACLFPLLSAFTHAAASHEIAIWLGLMTFLSLLTLALRWYGQGFEYRGQLAAATHELRMRLGEQLRSMPLTTLQSARAGDINALLLGSVDENLNYMLAIVNQLLLAIVTPVVIALVMLMVEWRLGVSLLLIFPAIALLYRWRRPAFAHTMQALAEANQQTSADIVEYVQGLAVLRTSCQQAERTSALRQRFQHLQQIQTSAHRSGAKPGAVVASVVELGLQGVLILGISGVVVGAWDIAIVAAMMVIVVRFSEPLATFVSYTAVLELINTALRRIDDLLAIEPLPVHQPVDVPLTYAVTFEQVSFRYANEAEAVFDSVDIALPEKGMTALVGPSGSGKTTITRLLMRHADPQRGHVCIGGVDIRHIPTREVNRLISVVFQDVYLFDDSVLANIRMARPDASDAEVERAAEAAQCLDFIQRLPQGWQTRLGDIGGRLSGGERQRISIARALLKDAPIVILDEPTAALDTESELAVQRAIDRLVQDKTVIVIAHRLSTIVGAHRILVVENGGISQQGTHNELLHAEGRYRALWNAQQSISLN
ncbi:ABC transporter ATP-binding protein [Pectobacterium brasiliense]|uniref:ABC transporter ATP-binding protein n=1 Tax=Pectobacterium brasiliense TaxID=180957 RepID=A0A433NH76_9GAMM|nr:MULTISPECIES: ABC transporter ATP-binding protein [Pectobacterium]GKW26886.1 ABC transporter permease [Pectobacterium carotovorum subsp. carotovorum]MBN3047835.1 ABC transporter ATP-binding protein [Pectobacterium brasiliense]MBN3076679.1 ABC transporter ATP-binding protein [Pectobacterium brasiliense]MBN3084155.1 ABC transporter ATP-binding protein [Pectobacterium brasiliense]MBN3088418.1 ABC transporter ATP-binding protein [Pectobacterium brasiliense]